ncbi:ribosome biogenesis protein ytm1 [Linderina macrospora]|uniref:Ribosome biogenesis protein ytm1 n=1 Tax=Linderina macrospora TaxID=4868 RepID=A0ACC1JEG5_9FUNG|nr:ribosome biogenesis protein ytm1 [Linderina macrospora]
MSKRLRRSRRETTAAEDTDIAKYSAEEQLSLLETWLESAKASTYEAINSHHRDFLTIRLYGKDPLDEVATLNDKCETVRTSVSNNADYQQRLDAIGQGLDATMRLAKTHADLKEVDEQIMHGEVAVAASTIAEVCDLLKGLEGDCPQFVEHSAVATLQTQYIKKRSALRAELDYLMSKMYAVRSIGSVYELAVSYSVTANYDGVPYETPITISDVFFALTQLGLDKEKVAPLAKTLVDHWFVPLLRSPAETLSVSKVSMFATMNIGAFTPDRREDEVDQGADLQVQCELVRDKWETVLGFIREEIFHDINPMEDHTEIYVYLGANLWSSLCPLLEEYLLIPLIPTDLDSLTDTRAMVPLLRLEEAWLDYGLITPEALVVKESVRSSLQNYINKRRRDLLTTVASILATDDTNTVVVGGAGPVADVLSEMASGGKKSSEKNSKTKGKGFAMSAEGDGEDAGSLTFPRCSISVQAQMLVEFAQETIGLSLEDDAKTAVLYLHAVRDAFALYRCLIPRQWATELLVNPKRAFVMHNDCEFICHHLSTLGFRYRERWPAVVKSAATFVDTIGTYPGTETS